MNSKLIADSQDLQSDLSVLRSEVTTLQDANSKLLSDIAGKDTTIQLKDASVKRNDSELEAKSKALEEKDVIISAMSEQLIKARAYLMIKKQVEILIPSVPLPPPPRHFPLMWSMECTE